MMRQSLRVVLILLGLALPRTVQAQSVDLSECRQNTYGAPTHWADATRSLASNGTGTSGDPWNLNQAKANAVARNVVCFKSLANSMNSSFVQLAAPNSSNNAAFAPANSGTSGNRIVFVAQVAAITLDTASITTNNSRTELRHAGTAAVARGQTESGTGGPTIGANGKNYITFDGFFIDMAQAEIRTDSGVIRPQNTNGFHVRNFVIKGTDTNCQSNCVIYRPGDTIGDVLYNFKVFGGFHNNPTGSAVRQPALFSDQYGSRDFTIEHGLIEDLDFGIFTKGSSSFDQQNELNYGSIRYNICRRTSSCFRFNALDAAQTTTVRYNLGYDTITNNGYMELDGSMLVLEGIASGQLRNLLLDHLTLAKVDAESLNTQGCIVNEDNPLGVNVVITNNICDQDNGRFGHMVFFVSTNLPSSLNFNYYTKNGGGELWARNSTTYGPGQNGDFAGWKSATSLDTNSIDGGRSSPFVDRANNDFRIRAGHAAKTGSSTGGEMGAYASPETLGPITSGSPAGGRGAGGELAVPVLALVMFGGTQAFVRRRVRSSRIS